jgi:AAA15 family ATPase/GTPase
MIREFYIDNFKSLVDFHVQLDKFTCLIGLNGSGKSTILQAIDFITQLVKGNIENEWLETREWLLKDWFYYNGSSSNIRFSVKLKFEEFDYSWTGDSIKVQ